MFGSATIDIAIGIIFVFLMVSLIASTVNELILSMFNMRGKDLLSGIQMLLNDESANGLVSKLYNHGQIFGLFKGEFRLEDKSNLPSYIPGQNFVMALLDIVREEAGVTVGQSTSPPTGPLTSPPGANDFSAQLSAVTQDAATTLAHLRMAALKLAAPGAATEKVGKPLVSMIDAAGADINKLQKSVEDWYNSAMDRVSGWYKNRAQWVLGGIGLVLAVGLNADAVRIVRQLSSDTTLRQSVVAAAQSARPAETTGGQPVDQQIAKVQDQVSKIKDFGIPIGWSLPAGARKQTQDQGWLVTLQSVPNISDEGWLQVFAGWLLTAFAVSLGAPFWFDLLNKFMVVRSTVKPAAPGQKDGQTNQKQTSTA
jgi:hypothetical protein